MYNEMLFYSFVADVASVPGYNSIYKNTIHIQPLYTE